MKKITSFPLIILIVWLLVVASTLFAWQISKKLVEKETTRLFNQQVDTVEYWITNRLELYKTIGFSLAAFVSHKENLTEEEWQTFTEALQISQRFPGITALSFTKKEKEGFKIALVYPQEFKNLVGIEVITLPERREAILEAIETGKQTITKKILLLTDNKPGFLIYFPVYKIGVPTTTPEERKTAALGVITLAFRSEEVFKDLFDAQDTFPYLDFELYKGKNLEEDYILYDHDYSVYIPKEERQKRLEAKRTIIFNGESLTLLAVSKPSFGLKTLEKQQPNIVLVGGLLLSLWFLKFSCWEFKKLSRRSERSDT